jgi:gluconolactonase
MSTLAILLIALATPILAQPYDEVRVAATAAFTEGPATDADGNIYFTETVNNRIYKFTPGKGITVFRENSNAANGLVFDVQGRLIACEGGGESRRNPRVTRTDIKTGKMEVLAGAERGTPLNRPNDVTVDGRGRIYFTDPGPAGKSAVYRIDPDGKLTRILAEPAIERPNGLMISPDDRTFYLIETNRTDFGKTDKLARMIRAYDLSPEGAVSNMRVFHDFHPGRSADGSCIDTQGNLYAVAGLHLRRGTSETLDTRAGVYVFSPQGRLLRFIGIPEDTVTNCTFGGPGMRTLYVTAGKTLFEVSVEVPGTRR